ncbi:MAG: PEP-CTERM sorting domain-containing protein [Cyanobacteriota bacterium]|nr:PEP-CTERM sorting domain-containing protein [Cyanobacteriota bacterium]
MKRVSRIMTSATIATTAIACLSAAAEAKTLDFDLLFETSNQSIWDTGNALNFTDDRFLGVDWDESVSKGFEIPIPFFDDIDIGFSAFTNGKVGLQSTLDLNGGTVNALIPVNLFLTLPDEPVLKGETFVVQSGFSFADTATFNTSSPDASYNLDFIFDVAAGIDVNPGFDLGFDIDKSSNLVSFDSGDLSFEIDSNFGNLGVSFPEIETTGSLSGSHQLASSGEDEFLEGTLDVDAIATSLFGLPPLQGSKSVNLPIVDDLGFSYNLLDIETAASLSVLQSFFLTGTLPALFTLENGTQIPFKIGEDIAIAMPDNVGEFLDIDASIDFNALFSNTTSLGLDWFLDVLAGEFDLELPLLPDFSAGPLFQDRIELVDTSFEVFDKTFDLAGFNQEQIAFQVETETVPEPAEVFNPTFNVAGFNQEQIASQVETVPEPTPTLGLLTLGTLGAGLILKRKQKQV